MNNEGSHYEVLGIDMDAPPHIVTYAIEWAERQADALEETSPDRAAEARQHIQRIKDDLLDRHKREAYNQALMQPRAASPLPEDRDPEPISRDVIPVVIPGKPPRSRRMRGRTLVVVGAVLACLLALLFAVHAQSLQDAISPNSLALQLSTGGVSGEGVESGRIIDLRWRAVKQASRYRLQVAISPVQRRNADAFAHQVLNVTTVATHYRLRVTGKQFYYWRVRPMIGSSWNPYSAAKHFLVQPPSVGRPQPSSTVAASYVPVQERRLCWSAVRNATSYRLRIDGVTTKTISGTCTFVALKQGKHHWQVAALTRGARVYVGPYSAALTITVAAPPHRVIRVAGPHPKATAQVPPPHPHTTPTHPWKAGLWVRTVISGNPASVTFYTIGVGLKPGSPVLASERYGNGQSTSYAGGSPDASGNLYVWGTYPCSSPMLPVIGSLTATPLEGVTLVVPFDIHC